MTDFAEATTILAAGRIGSDLVLRIDSNLWSADITGASQVRVLTLHQAAIEDSENPATWVGHHVYVNEYGDGGEQVVELYINYAVDYVEVRCRGTSEVSASYSTDDLAAKLATISDVAKQYAKQSAKTEQELQRVRREVGEKIRREIDVGDRKRQFFAITRPDRARAIEFELKFLRELAAVLEPGAAT
jgi:hypothetical protein